MLQKLKNNLFTFRCLSFTTKKLGKLNYLYVTNQFSINCIFTEIAMLLDIHIYI